MAVAAVAAVAAAVAVASGRRRSSEVALTGKGRDAYIFWTTNMLKS